MNERDPILLELAALRAENDKLRDQVRNLKDTFLSPAPVFSSIFKLTKNESAMLSAIFRSSGFLPTRALHIAMHGLDPDTDPKIVAVYVCKLRKKLRPHGITIESIWGEGYRIVGDSRERLRALIGVDRAEVPEAAS